MNRFARSVSLLIVVLGFLAATVSAADVGGKWIGDVNTPDGQSISLTFTFKLDGGKVTGTVTGPTGDIDISDGKMDGDTITEGRLALGGVAHKPWRLTAAETALRGVSLDDTDALKAAIAASFTEARPLEHNVF